MQKIMKQSTRGGAGAHRGVVSAVVVGLCVAMGLPASTATGQDLTVTAPAQDHAIVLTGGTVHLPDRDIEKGIVVFGGGEITTVGDATALARMSFSEDTEFINVAGQHVYPGLIAPMTRLGLIEVGAVRATHDYDELGEATPEVRAIVAVNPDSTIIPVTRSNGVLLAGVFPQGDVVPGRASVIKLEGWTWEDMSATADPKTDAGLVINWPAARVNTNRWTGKADDDREEQRRWSIADLRELFDSARAYASAKDHRPGGATDLRLEALIPILEGRQRAFINANDVEQIQDAVAFAIEQGIDMVLTGGRDATLCADLLIEHDIPVIVQGTHRFPKRADSPHDAPYSLPARLRDAGVKFAINSADRDGNIRNLPHEAAMAARYGLTDREAVNAITIDAAEALGVADRYGSLEAGKAATLVVTDGNILDIPTNPTMAFVDGRRIDLSNKQTKLRDKYEERYLQTGDLLGE